jgi:hypothetical protein
MNLTLRFLRLDTWAIPPRPFKMLPPLLLVFGPPTLLAALVALGGGTFETISWSWKVGFGFSLVSDLEPAEDRKSGQPGTSLTERLFKQAMEDRWLIAV